MTDLITRNDSGSAGDVAAPPPDTRRKSAESPRRKRRLALWIGIPVGVVVLGAAATSLFLVAPGTTIGGVPVGFMTPTAAADAVRDQIGGTTVTIGDGGPAVTGSELGATVDADALAGAAFEQRPMWNVTQWFGEPIDATVTLDQNAAMNTLHSVVPEMYVDPTPAAISFDGAAYVVIPAVDGSGIGMDNVAAGVQEAFTSGAMTATVTPETTTLSSPTTTELAQQTADRLNGMLAQIGFYVDDERVVPVDAATAASWITVSTDSDGAFQFAADPAKIQAVVPTLAAAVDRAPTNGFAIVNSNGTILDDTEAGVDGRALGDTSGLAEGFAAQLATGDAVYRLPVEVTPAVTEQVVRQLEVDLSKQMLYMVENGAVIDSWSVSTGRSGGAETTPGTYQIGWKTTIQDMSGVAPDSGKSYIQPDVRWAMYFNGDQAFHGVYWHSNWGTPMSAGCVGMPESRAEQIYYWAASGTDVWIHY